MIGVTLNHAVQRFHSATLGIEGEFVPVGDLIPDQDADFVSGLQISWIGDFDMAAKQIQAQCLRFSHFIAQIVDGGRFAEGVGEEVLVECTTKVYRLAVQVEFAVAGNETAETETMMNGITGTQR